MTRITRLTPMAPDSIGKRVFDDLYIHRSAAALLSDSDHRELVTAALNAVRDATPEPNVIKLNLRSGWVSLLAYERFEEDPFPTLAASWLFNRGSNGQPTFRSYVDSLNPPILHRKELLVGPDHPDRERWAEVTRAAEELGLFDESQAIGFRLNWERLIRSKGYQVVDGSFLPIGNAVEPNVALDGIDSACSVQRHLTALMRNDLSAPVQLLLRRGLLDEKKSFFDYGCGRGGDVAGLRANGYDAAGWDPHFAPDQPLREADVVNLGFVVNVIEDPAERVEAMRKAFALTKQVLSIGVMLYGGATAGVPFRDGFLTSRNTFQKYFTQPELKDYVEHVLGREAFMIAPGICFVFADSKLEQHFSAGRYRSSGVAARLLAQRVPARPSEGDEREQRRRLQIRSPRAVAAPRLSRLETLLARVRPVLDSLWATALELGRFPEADEVNNLAEVLKELGSFERALRLLQRHYEPALLSAARRTRTDDLRLFFAMQQFVRRPPFRSLELRLQRDVKAFFSEYRSAQTQGLRLLKEAADVGAIRQACRAAAENGIGWLDDDRALQLHVSLVDRLPVVLRTYVACGLLLHDAASDFQLIKIHIESGKLTLLQYDDFDGSPLPLLAKRIKVNIRRQTYDTFEYGNAQYPKPPLYRKSRYLHEDMPGYAEQLHFDEELDAARLWDDEAAEPSSRELAVLLDERRLTIEGFRLIRSRSIPDLDQRCGANFRYRDFVECGETQHRLRLPNIPLNPDSYNALHDLATQILDPLIDYFGGIRLTYGFSSTALAKHIQGRIAPKLDQHAACECGRGAVPVCERGGAACDFIVDHERMSEVADWIIANLPFDRLYFYGDDRPLHVSFGPQHARAAYAMVTTASGKLLPRPYRAASTAPAS